MGEVSLCDELFFLDPAVKPWDDRELAQRSNRERAINERIE